MSNGEREIDYDNSAYVYKQFEQRINQIVDKSMNGGLVIF